MALFEKHLQVKESKIPGAGLGVFTTVDIPKGEKVVEYKGKIRTWKEMENDDSNYYIFYINENHVIDGSSSKKSIARYVNDARGLTKIKGLNNNAKFVTMGLRVFIISNKDIAAGSEILVGYGKEYWEVIRKNMATAKREAKMKKESSRR